MKKYPMCKKYWNYRAIESTAVICCGVCLLLLAGCDGSGDRRGVEGTVTLDGQPLAEGSITMRPLPGTTSPTAGAKITDGKFTIPKEKGPLVGTFRVEITATRKTGRQIKDPLMGGMVEEVQQVIPSRYNRKSELTAEVTETGQNRMDFELNLK